MANGNKSRSKIFFRKHDRGRCERELFFSSITNFFNVLNASARARAPEYFIYDDRTDLSSALFLRRRSKMHNRAKKREERGKKERKREIKGESKSRDVLSVKEERNFYFGAWEIA